MNNTIVKKNKKYVTTANKTSIQPVAIETSGACLWPIHPVFPEGAGEMYFTGLRRAMLNPVPSPKAVNGGATGECGGSRGDWCDWFL